MIKYKVETLPLDTLKPAPYNPRRISKEALKGLTASIKRFGLVQPIVLNKRTGFVVGGHQRIAALKAAGQNEAMVVTVDLSDSEEKALNVALNSPAISGTFTDDLQGILSNLREELPHEFIDIRMDELIRDLKVQAPNEDEIPEPPKTPITKPGDTWSLGDHTVICGDSTDPLTGQRIQEAGAANLLFTSPPYWVGMSYEYQKSLSEIAQFIEKSSSLIAGVVRKDHTRVIINTGTGNGKQYTRRVETLLILDQWINALKKHGWLMRHLRCWVKRGGMPASIPPHNDFIDQHSEFIATFYHEQGKNRGQFRLFEKWVLQGFIDDIKGEAKGSQHCASFPVELPHRFIRLYTRPGERVIDIFGGAGTTLIACQQTGRKCTLVERNPAYCDVIIERFEKFTGQKAVRSKK